MATATNPNSNLDATAEQVKELNDRLGSAGKGAGKRYLDSYDRTVESVTAFQKKLADESNNELVQTVVGAQVDATREIAKAYSSVARETIA
jgi:hypothetical protein